MKRSAAHAQWPILYRQGKKNGRKIHQEVTRAVDQLLRILCNGRHQAGHLDLEATEMLVRSAMH